MRRFLTRLVRRLGLCPEAYVTYTTTYSAGSPESRWSELEVFAYEPPPERPGGTTVNG